MSGEWIAVYQRYGSIGSDVFDTEDDAITFLHEQEEARALVAISAHGPNGEKWDSARIARHFRKIWEEEHAEEIAEEKRQAEEAKARHEAWLAAQPPWKRDRCSLVRGSVEDGYPKIELDGVLLPFQVFEPEVVYEHESGHRLRLTIPLAAPCRLEIKNGSGSVIRSGQWSAS